MKKILVLVLVSVLLATLSMLGCEEDKNASLIVRNEMGFAVSHFSLDGFNGGDNLLPSGTILQDSGDPFEIPVDIAPGEYSWHVEYSEGMMSDGEDGPTKAELFPGPNHLVLSR